MTAIRRIGLVGFGIVVPLLLAEGALQISSKFYRATLLATRAEPVDFKAKRILCVGDSNTFGVRVAAADSYPGQLERMLNACSTDGTHWQVLNRGIPGQNTTQIRNSLPDLLTWCNPDVVIVLAGINNAWNDAPTLEAESWLDRVRLVRLARLALNNLRAGPNSAAGNGRLEVATVSRLDPNTPLDQAAVFTRTDADLAAIVRSTRAADATPVIMTYPGQHPSMGPLNQVARDVAAREGVLLVDHDKAFAGYVEKYGYDAILFEDSHPAEAGYQLESRDIVKAFSAAALAAEKLPEDQYEPTLTLRKPIELRLERNATGDPARLLLKGEAGYGFQIYVSPVQSPQLDLGSRKIPIGVHPWLQFCEKYAPFKGALDANGDATVDLPAQVSSMAPGEVLYCAFVTLDPRSPHSLAVRSISKAILIQREAR